MICPNCKATDHESGAKFCHKCGSPLVNNSDRERPKPQDQSPYGVEAVDLGLPSGTRWANMNIGATRPEEFGGYYAWGEVTEKSNYDWPTYTHCDGTIESCRDIGSNISGTQYDVAYVKWGDRWRMPTFEQIKELWIECSTKWTKFNGIWGCEFTGLNGNSIFVPAAGYRVGTYTQAQTGYCKLWSGGLCLDKKGSIPKAFVLKADISENIADDRDYCDVFVIEQPIVMGLSVRPVTNSFID